MTPTIETLQPSLGAVSQPLASTGSDIIKSAPAVRRWQLIGMSGALALTSLIGTSANGALASDTPEILLRPEGTASGYGVVHVGLFTNGSSRTIQSLRGLSGLTWDELARVFGVSRRTMHNWAGGSRLSRRHEQRLKAVLAIIQQVGEPTPTEMRSRLLRLTASGASIFDMLVQHRDDAVREVQESRAKLARTPLAGDRPPALTPEVRAQRRLADPIDLLAAEHGRVSSTLTYLAAVHLPV